MEQTDEDKNHHIKIQLDQLNRLEDFCLYDSLFIFSYEFEFYKIIMINIFLHMIYTAVASFFFSLFI